MTDELPPSRRHENRLRVDIGVFEPEIRCFTREISRHVIWLDDSPTLSAGEMVWLHLHLPEGRVLEATATVRKPPMGSHSWALEFSMFLRGGHRAWEDHLEALGRGEKPQGADRRVWPRHEGVRFVVRAGDHEWQTANHSLGGLFVASKLLLPVGDEVELALIHPETRETLVLKAEVARLQPGMGDEPRGMGLRFLDVDEAQLEALAGFLTTGALD